MDAHVEELIERIKITSKRGNAVAIGSAIMLLGALTELLILLEIASLEEMIELIEVKKDPSKLLALLKRKKEFALEQLKKDSDPNSS